jgi:hypothetical protein
MKVSEFTQELKQYSAKRGIEVSQWRGAHRNTENLLQISDGRERVLLYVKYRSDPPGWWGINENQLSSLSSSGLHWFVVLLVGGAESGYMLSSRQVSQGLSRGRWSRDQNDYKLHEGPEVRRDNRKITHRDHRNFTHPWFV